MRDERNYRVTASSILQFTSNEFHFRLARDFAARSLARSGRVRRNHIKNPTLLNGERRNIVTRFSIRWRNIEIAFRRVATGD